MTSYKSNYKAQSPDTIRMGYKASTYEFLEDMNIETITGRLKNTTCVYLTNIYVAFNFC